MIKELKTILHTNKKALTFLLCIFFADIQFAQPAIKTPISSKEAGIWGVWQIVDQVADIMVIFDETDKAFWSEGFKYQAYKLNKALLLELKPIRIQKGNTYKRLLFEVKKRNEMLILIDLDSKEEIALRPHCHDVNNSVIRFNSDTNVEFDCKGEKTLRR